MAIAHSDWNVRNTKLQESTEGGGSLRNHSIVTYDESIDLETFLEMTESLRYKFRYEMIMRDRRAKPSRPDS